MSAGSPHPDTRPAGRGRIACRAGGRGGVGGRPGPAPARPGGGGAGGGGGGAGGPAAPGPRPPAPAPAGGGGGAAPPSPRHYDCDLAQRVRGRPRSQLGEGAAPDLLVRLGQLAAHDGGPPAAESLREPGQGLGEPAPRLEEDQRPRLAGQLREPAAPPPPPPPPGTPPPPPAP